MKRIAIYACYSKENKVEDYVIYYLNELKKIADVVIVYDNSLDEDSIEQLRNYTIHGIFTNHNMYDFGSYKIGIEWLVNNGLIQKYDSLILCNDSVFGPFYPFENYFKTMESKRNVDFWGFIKYQYNRKLAERLDVIHFEHIQSYFIVLNKCIISDFNFFNFFKLVTKEESNRDVIKKYEIGLSQFLYKLGYKSDGIFVTDKDLLYSKNKTLKRIKKGFPFLKKKFFTMSPNNFSYYQNKYQKIKRTISPYSMDLIDIVIDHKE
ncbi:MAG: rhamnan synthesis F family protein [Spirochaetales bacterium]|nr:rhamnan synthesis F family protein [Spirochaetales bacterium]